MNGLKMQKQLDLMNTHLSIYTLTFIHVCGVLYTQNWCNAIFFL